MFKLPFSWKRAKIKPTVLLVLDGFGLAPASEGNAITRAKTPNYDRYLKDYPHSSLIASGESVGLPANEVGNTEVGHLTIGAGRVILQDLKRIDIAIEKGHFYDNKAFLKAAGHVRDSNSKLHILGLVGSGRVHSSVDHLYALLQFCKKEQVQRVYLHLFTDGRDSPPKEGIELIERIERRLKDIRLGKIASITGRYYAMDRDRRWDRTEKAYKAMVLGRAIRANSAREAVENAYNKGQTDEFIEPTVVLSKEGNVNLVEDNDAIVFFNFRVDRPKQLSMAFVIPDFENLKSFDFGYDPATNIRLGEVEMDKTFQREKIIKNLFFVTMTEYHKDLPVSAVAYAPEIVEKPLGVVLAENGLKQMHMAESEKERFVKYYFNGLREDSLDGEEDLIVPSPKVATYDRKPQMSLPKLLSEFKRNLKRDYFHFFVLNFANPDMVAHSGNLEATIKAIEFVDKYAAQLVRAVLAVDGTVYLTADHGNAEELLTFPSTTYFYTTAKGSINTDHSNNPVPFVVISNEFKGRNVEVVNGGLCDVATTILGGMNLAIPEEMTGKNLVKSV